MPYCHMVSSVNKPHTERDACLSVHLEECLATNKASVRKTAGEERKKTKKKKRKNQKMPIRLLIPMGASTFKL